MKKALTTSILLNLALAICLFALLKQPKRDLAPASEVAPTATATRQEPDNTEAGGPTWKQVEPIAEQTASAQIPQSTQIPVANRIKERPATMPLVFQDVDVSQLKLNSEQLKAIEDLRQKFLDEIGGLEQDPNDPAYKERWTKSQPEIDNDLRGFIGMTAFQDYQIEASVGEKSR